MLKATRLAGLAASALASEAAAVSVWSEALDGDFSDFIQPRPGGSADLGFLAPLGTYRVGGSLTGGETFTSDPLNVEDPFDNFQFDVQSGFQVSFADVSLARGAGIELRLRKFGPFNDTSAFVALSVQKAPGIDVSGDAGLLSPRLCLIEVDLDSPGFIGAASYAIEIETGPPVIVIPDPPDPGPGGGGEAPAVPLPAGLPLLLGALGAIGLLRGRSGGA